MTWAQATYTTDQLNRKGIFTLSASFLPIYAARAVPTWAVDKFSEILETSKTPPNNYEMLAKKVFSDNTMCKKRKTSSLPLYCFSSPSRWSCAEVFQNYTYRECLIDWCKWNCLWIRNIQADYQPEWKKTLQRVFHSSFEFCRQFSILQAHYQVR